jgi:hypothetical protein
MLTLLVSLACAGVLFIDWVIVGILIYSGARIVSMDWVSLIILPIIFGGYLWVFFTASRNAARSNLGLIIDILVVLVWMGIVKHDFARILFGL